MPQQRLHESDAQRQRAYRQRCQDARTAQLSARQLPPLPAIASIPGDTRWKALVLQALWALKTVHGERETYFELRTDTWKENERGQAFQDNTEDLLDLCNALEDYCSHYGAANK